MVAKKRDHNTMLRRPAPAAMLLTILLALGISGVADYLVVVLLAAAFFAALNHALAQNGIFGTGEAFPSAELLDELACTLRSMPPEAAFAELYRSHPTRPELFHIVRSIAEGRPLSQSLRAVALEFGNTTGIFPIIADLLSYDANAAADGISRIAEVQREKQRMRAELDEKVAILSFRSTILSLIGSASMAIIAFSFPLLGAAGPSSSTAAVGNIPLLHFDAPAFFSLLSVALLSSCLSSMLVRGNSPLKPLLLPAVIYLSTYVILILTIGSTL